MVDNMAWHSAAKEYLARLGRDEWIAQGCPVPTKRRPHNKFSPSEYMRALIDCLNKNDEEAFKEIKMREGYASAAGV